MNRVVVITGASSGIGKATKEKFEANGDIVYNLALEDLNEKNYYKCDISNSAEVERIINEIGQKEGKINILINNAGYGISGAIELTTDEQAKRIFEVNTLGSFYVMKHAIKFMQSGDKIINIVSACALFPVPFRSFYCASKSALNMLSYGLSMELKPLNIQVCSVCPGEVKTNFTKNRVKNFETNERYGERISNAAHYIDKRQDKRMSPEIVANRIFKQANKKKMKNMIIISKTYHILYPISRIIPIKWLLNSTNKLLGGFKK